jgi:TonB-linked SusC/RagA family outer membrane protein
MMKNYSTTFGKAILVLLMILPIIAFSQVRYTIKGKVTDGAGEPLIGANVNIGGTLQGTTTDLDGAYVLSGAVRPGAYSLVASYIGFAAKVEQITISDAGGDQMKDFQLGQDRTNLDEVIVTGNSSTTTRRQLGNSISVVRADALEKTGTTNTLAALSGKVMGAQISQNSGDPAGGMSVRLRGAGSINSSSDPLYIIDGVIVDNSSQNVINRSADAMTTSFSAGQNRLIDINPNDIERVEVLNGAAAAAIYGSRAGNGVVQIFTKRGKAGKNVIEFSSSFMVSSLRKKIFMSQVGERFGVKGNDRLESTQDRLTTILNLYPNTAVPGKTAVQVMDANGVKYTGVGLDPKNPARFLITDKYAVKRYDYQDNIFSDAMGTDNNLSMSGGNDKTQYFASFGFFDNDGIVTNTNYKKYTGRLNLDHMINSWAKFSAGLGYTYGVSQDMPNGNNFFNPISAMFISDNVWDITERDANGNLKQTEKVRVNPLSIIETFKLSQRTNRTIANAKLELFPIKGLKIDASIGTDAYTLRGDEYHPRLPYELSASVVPDFFPDGYVAQAVNNVSLLNHDLLANYTKEFGQISSSTTVGYNIQSSNTSFVSQEGRALSFGTTLNAASNLFKRTEASKTEQLLSGYFAQQTFGYKNQIYLTLAGRVDGSSVFAPENRNQFYPKAGLSWVLSDYWKGKGIEKIVSSAKVRGSFGEAGNLTGIGAYDRYDNYGVGAFNGVTAIAPSRTLANANVKPERKREKEFGLDLAFFNNRVGLNVNVYDQKVTDLLITSIMAPSGGGTRIIKNAPDSTYLTNKGVELMLTASVIKTKNFNWNVGLNWSTNKNKIFGVEGGLISLRGSDGTQSVVNGQPYGIFYGRYYARDASGNLLLTAGGLRQPTRGTQPISSKPGTEVLVDGQPSTKGTVELRKVIGDPNPDWIGSFTSGLAYKNISFAFQFDAFWGADIYNWNRITSNNVGWGEIADQEIRGVIPRGSVAAIAGGIGGQRIQEEHVEDASYIKLREISLTYDFGTKIKNFKGLSVGIIGRNLYSFDSYQGFDPETNSAGQSDRVRGDDFGAVPIPRTIMGRISVKF